MPVNIAKLLYFFISYQAQSSAIYPYIAYGWHGRKGTGPIIINDKTVRSRAAKQKNNSI